MLDLVPNILKASLFCKELNAGGFKFIGPSIYNKSYSDLFAGVLVFLFP